MKFSLAILFAFIISGCSNTRPFIRDSSDYLTYKKPPVDHTILTFYALGDWGTGNDDQKTVANLLKNDIELINPTIQFPPFVVELGDNIYDEGLPAGWNNSIAHSLLEKTFGEVYSDITFNNNPVPFHLVPGNHDHRLDIIQQETLAEAKYPNWNYYPISVDRKRIPNDNDEQEYNLLHQSELFEITMPERVKLPPNAPVAVIALDTEILLRLEKSENAIFRKKHWDHLEGIMRDVKDKWIILIGHHPISTHGLHGSFHPFKKWFWGGPAYVLNIIYMPLRHLIIKPLQDTNNRKYKSFARKLENLMKDYNAVYVSGHDHSLQLLDLGTNLQVISGSAGKTTGVGKKNDTIFAHEALGFTRFDVTNDNKLWIQFYCKGENCSKSPTAIFNIPSREIDLN